MIVKFLANKGGGSAKATMNYLLGANQDREQALVLQGDPKLTQQLADSLDFKNKYTVGVLSFQEKDLDDATKQEIMDKFEKTLFAGLEREQYDITWIQHQDKDRLELNFVIPKVELTTGKALNPYFDAVDRTRVNAFKDYINAKFDLSDPNDPSRKQPLALKSELPRDKKELQEAITGFLMQKMDEGSIKDRQDILNALQSDLGLSVARITPNSISISDPTNEKGRNIRLKGEIYAKDFRFSENYRAENERASQEYRDNRTKRIEQAGTILATEIERKREYHQRLYSTEHQADQRQNQKDNALQATDRGDNRLSDSVHHDFIGNDDMARHGSAGQTQRNTSIGASDSRHTDRTEIFSQSGHHNDQNRQNTSDSQATQKSDSRAIKQQKTNFGSGVTDYAKRLFGNVRKLITRARTAIERIRASNQDQRSENHTTREFASTSHAGNATIDRSEQQLNQSQQQLNQSKQATSELDKEIEMKRGIDREIEL